MKIAIFSDIHVGFGIGTERENDPFDALKEAIEKSLDCDIILICGDIFDSKKPSADIFSRTIEILLKPLLFSSGAKPVIGIGKDISSLPPLSVLGIPIIAIHGNHERRAKGLINPVQSMERAGFLIYLHCNGIVVEKGDERVAIQGMGAIPEEFVKDVLKEWDPIPIKNCFNIFMFHQLLEGFVFSKSTLKKDILPNGFDLYVTGDLHKPYKDIYNGKNIIFVGSLIPTQLEKNETKQKGIWKVDTKNRKIEFCALEKQRSFYYLEFEGADKKKIKNKIEMILKKGHEKKPIIRIKVKEDIDFIDEIKDIFEDKAIISFRKNIKIEHLVFNKIEDHILSVQEMGRKILERNLAKYGLDKNVFRTIFELLSEGNEEDVINILESKKKNKKD